jgi:hypothetical protein
MPNASRTDRNPYKQAEPPGAASGRKHAMSTGVKRYTYGIYNGTFVCEERNDGAVVSYDDYSALRAVLAEYVGRCHCCNCMAVDGELYRELTALQVRARALLGEK